MRPSFHAFADEFSKLAKEEKKSPAWDIAKILGAGTLGFGAGTAAGLGTYWAANKLHEHLTGKGLPKHPLFLAAPLLGTGAGIAYSVQKAKEQEAIRRALENSTEPSERGVPGR